MGAEAVLTCDEFLDLAAAVALDATDAEDVRRVEQHAADCPACGTWLYEFRTTAAALGSFVRQLEPPPEIRTRLFQAVHREPRPLAVVRRIWPRAARSRFRVSAAWLVAAESFVLAIVALAWVAVLQAQISDLRNNAVVASARAARFDRFVNVLASDKLAVKPL